MGLALDEEIRIRLDRTRAGLAREFEHLSQAEVDLRFDQIVAQLLVDATFAEFIPVLAWRYSREALKTMPGLPAEYRA
jgi:hypothetical protein